jgi:hypothetical protein
MSKVANIKESVVSWTRRNLLLFSIIAGPVALAATLQFKFQTTKSPQDVFKTQGEGQASFYYDYMPYLEWKEKQSGKYFPMDVAPVLNGKATGGVPMPAAQPVDPAKYSDQAKEFAGVVNLRNQGGRAEIETKAGTPEQQLAEEEASTYVVQTVLSAVLDRPVSQLKLSAEKFELMLETIDVDHYHFKIPGTFALGALEKDHAAARTLKPDHTYLLSVIDFRDYGCAAMKDGLRDYFSKLPEKQRLMNESIYLISGFELNTPYDLAAAEKYFGKRPDAIVTQEIIYADHLVRGAKTIFVFFSEGQKTRVVLLSNVALRSKFFTGAKGMLTRQYILDGIGGGVTGVVLNTKDAVSDLLAGATADVKTKNSCNRGLAQGLIKYSQGLFTEFAGFMLKN